MTYKRNPSVPFKWTYEDELPGDITNEMFEQSRIIDGVRMYPASVPQPCEACGDLMKHDDDGPRLCRFCQQCQKAVSASTSLPEQIALWWDRRGCDGKA